MSFNIVIHDLKEKDQCDLTGKSDVECVVCQINDEPCIIASNEFLKLVRLEAKRRDRKNATATGGKSAK
jgi:hypothetical protein